MVLDVVDPVAQPNVALLRLLVAALLGGLVGVEREQHRAEEEERIFAGVRTFPMFAILGAALTLISGEVGAAVLAGFLALAALVVASYLRTSTAGHVGTTTETAALATYWLGVMAGTGALVVAGAVGVTVAVLLATKERLEAVPRAVTPQELRAALLLAVLAVIVLPLLPDRPYGPWGIWNPWKLWLLVVLVCGLSFAAWVAIRLWGSRQGLALSGALGGLVSSTAVTISFATHSRAAPAQGRQLVVGGGLASLVMVVRIAVLASAVNTAVLVSLAPVLALMMGGAGLGILAIARRDQGEPGAPPKLANPFQLGPAIRFALLYAAVLLAVEAARRYLGSGGLVAASALTGLLDVDAITLSLSSLAGQRMTVSAATTGIAIAALANTVAKLGYALWLGQGFYRGGMAVVLGLALVGGVVGLGLGVVGQW